MYRELQGCRRVQGQYYGTHNNFNVMVLDLPGPSLQVVRGAGEAVLAKNNIETRGPDGRGEALHGRI